jgi:hypothetical protein
MGTTRLTDMDVKNTPQVTMEDTESDWTSLPDDEAALEIYDTERAYKALQELAKRVDTVRDQSSLEAYHWGYQALTGNSEVIEHKAVSLESFGVGTLTKKTGLAKAIRAEADRLATKLSVSIENYARDIKEDFLMVCKTYDAAHRKLKATDADIEETNSKKIDVNHTRIFDMFMVKDVFKGKEPITCIRQESQHLERLVAIVGKGVERLAKDVHGLTDEDKLERSARDLPDTATQLQLMFNRKAKVNDGQFDNEARKTRAPKKTHSWGQHFWIAFGGIMFGRLGYELSKSINSNKKDSEAKVTNSLTDIHKFIRHVEGMDEIVDDLAGHVQDLIELFKKVTEDQESALNRRSVPIIELANFIMKQIIDITKGTDTLFTRLVRKHSK